MNTKLKRVDQCLFLAYLEERKVALDRPRDMVLHMNMELNGYEGTSWATKQGYKRCKKLYFNFTRTPFLGSRYSYLVFKKEIIRSGYRVGYVVA
jgi:hypothetical protein